MTPEELLARIDERQKASERWQKSMEARFESLERSLGDVQETVRDNTNEMCKGKTALWVIGAIGSLVIATVAFLKDSLNFFR